jgi:uncharacterized protein YecT (DUF1311 family)
VAQANRCDSGSVPNADKCFDKLLDQANVDLAAKYAAAKTLIIPQDDVLLAQSQEEWSTYRAQTCDGLVGAFWRNGTLQNAAIASCKLALTRERIGDLDTMFRGLMATQ